MKLQLPQQVFEKYSNTEFHKNFFSGSRVVPCDPTDTQTKGRTDGQNTTKLIGAFRNFVSAPGRRD